MTVFYFFLAALALGILIFIHELGHYFVAKRMGMVVETFSIGFGRPLLKWQWEGVNWQLGWLPFGGYVKITGMEVSKKDKNTYTEPYEIPNGFFAKAPWRRMLVALAGPVANFILAFLVFTALWAMGGREKPFSEFTHIIGWVDPQSELYAQGLRPGDLLTEYNGKPYKGPKDLLYATMLGGRHIQLKGYHVNYATGERIPFQYQIESYPAPNAIEGILTTGVTAGARYLIYDHLPDKAPNQIQNGSPMEKSGITYGDRLAWADGEILFSMDQLSHILNDSKALLTVRRGNQTFLSRQPRVLISDLNLPSHVRNELMDWQYEAQLKGRWQDLKMLPYVINTNGYVEAPLSFIDEESRLQAFPSHPYSEKLQQRLEPGDQILAIDAMPIQAGYDLLERLQTHFVQLIVEKNVPVDKKVSWKEEDRIFQEAIHVDEVNALASTVGTPNPLVSSGRFVLLNPVEPKRIDQFDLSNDDRALLNAQYAAQKQEIEKIRDREKRAQALNYLEKSQERVLLGIILQDRQVNYNPGPWVLFGSMFSETWQTLRALVFGYLHPKWISGPIGIVQVIQQGWRVGVGEALFWIGAISLNLAVLNLLPIPVLDGGYICLSLWEMITRRRLKAKTLERLIIPFVVLLIALLVFLTFQDITRLF